MVYRDLCSLVFDSFGRPAVALGPGNERPAGEYVYTGDAGCPEALARAEVDLVESTFLDPKAISQLAAAHDDFLIECLFPESSYSDYSNIGPGSSTLRALLPGPGGDVGLEEVELTPLELQAEFAQHGLYARPDSRPMPGRKANLIDVFAAVIQTQTELSGDALETGREGQTVVEDDPGEWLQQLEAGIFPEVLAPGLKPAPGVGGVESRQHEQQALPDARQDGEEQAEQTEGEALQIENIFDGVWLEEEEEEEEEDKDRDEEEGQGEDGSLEEGEQGPGPVVWDNTLERMLQRSREEEEEGKEDGEADAFDLAGPHLLDDVLFGSRLDTEAMQPLPQRAPQLQRPGKASGRYAWAKAQAVDDLEEAYAALAPVMAMRFPFELDAFQKEAAVLLERGENVFVAAHTSAGKTIVAEYAFALASKHCTKAVYTSPMKAISNQKFRDFSSKFDVGLITGDVQVKTKSNCLIMTTEVLRSMLYNGADVIRDIEFVIFDEVHYINDVERGVVWEEVIIMLPQHVTLILLSATVPNVMELADWVGRTKRSAVNVIQTFHRPVPLLHELYLRGKRFAVFNSNGRGLMLDGLKEAQRHANKPAALDGRTTADSRAASASAPGRGAPGRGRGRGGGARSPNRGLAQAQRAIAAASAGSGQRWQAGALASNRQRWTELINHLHKHTLLPVMAFFFSKKFLDTTAESLTAINLTTQGEKHAIHAFCDKALMRLSPGDRDLPQIRRVRKLMQRGLAIHHAGLLPILKEVVEMLFCQGLLKVLLTTETFAMGVNAPARSVVFQALRKYDNTTMRPLLPIVIGCWQELPTESELRTMLVGSGGHLTSQFKLSYSMILNILRASDLKVEDMLKRSFLEFRAAKEQSQYASGRKQLDEALQRLQARPWPVCLLSTTRADVEDYYQLCRRVSGLRSSLQASPLATKVLKDMLVPEQLVMVQLDDLGGLPRLGVICERKPGGKGAYDDDDDDDPFGGGARGKKGKLRTMTEMPASAQPVQSSELAKVADGQRVVLLLHKHLPTPASARRQPAVLRHGASGGQHWELRRVAEEALVAVGRLKVKLNAKALLAPAASAEAHSSAFQEAAASAVAQLDKHREQALKQENLGTDTRGARAAQLLPKKVGKELKSLDLDARMALEEMWVALSRLAAMQCHSSPVLGEMFMRVHSEHLLEERRGLVRAHLSGSMLTQMPDFKARVLVLKDLGFVDEDSTVLMKGRSACCINSGDTLLMTEMVFRGHLVDLDVAEATALLSAFIFRDKSDYKPELPPALREAQHAITNLAKELAQRQVNRNVRIDPKEWLSSVLNFKLMQVVYEWAKGTPFSEICELTDVMEGSIVSSIVRLQQTCRELRNAARVIGDTALFQKMAEASLLIKRDIVFAASLYLS